MLSRTGFSGGKARRFLRAFASSAADSSGAVKPKTTGIGHAALDDGPGLKDFMRVVGERTRPRLVHDLPADVSPKRYEIFTKRHIKPLLEKYAPASLSSQWMDYFAPATVFPMRTNNYVVEELIDWSNVPNDPMFQLVFPQPGMLGEGDMDRMRGLVASGVQGGVRLQEEANKIRASLNPHPAGQKTENVPKVNGTPLPGLQHKYRETVLFFPTEAQYCHSYCTYCFRWAQFVSVGSSLQFASKDARLLSQYLAQNPHVSDILFTGGDPMVQNHQQFSRYFEAAFDNDHISTIRIGTKSLAYWPYRFVTDQDADGMLRLLEAAVERGKHVSIMAHFTHPVELSTPIVREALRRIRLTGAQVRCQAPLIRNVNDSADTWADMWKTQVNLGLVPYYMFVERDTGAVDHFAVPLTRAHKIFTDAFSQMSGLGRTVRGPSMSCEPGKVHVVGPAVVNGEKVLALKFLQARNPNWVDKVFFAKWDEQAIWLHDLKPAFGEEKFFYEDEYADRKSVV